jgi:Na+/H+-dicarboxylate symporter
MQHREECGRIILKYVLKIIVTTITGLIWFVLLANIVIPYNHVFIKISE